MKLKRVFDVTFQSIFWIWNLTFLTIVYAGILPFVGAYLIPAAVTGQIPGEYLITLLALVAVPTICTGLGWWRFRKQPLQLMRLFYGVEAPLFLLCLIRLFLLRELTPASTQIIGTIALCIAAFAVQLLYGYASQRRPLAWLQLLSHSLMLLTGIYVGAVLLFYALPLATVVIVEFLKFEWLAAFIQSLSWTALSVLWWGPILLVLFGFSCTLFIVMPSALAGLYIHSGRQILQAFSSQYGRKLTALGSLGVVVVWLSLFVALQQQPQVRAFALLEKPATTDSTRQSLLAQSEVIRKGLVNANLLAYRYLSTREENDHIRLMYQEVFGLPQSQAQVVQDIYNSFMSPFLYIGSRGDIQTAEKLYAAFFDAPLQKTEQKAVQHAIQSTANRDEAKAGLLNLNEKKVWLRSQTVTLKPQGDWADIELYEVYENQTFDQQEIFYSFSLPESAVITGLWLGDTGDRQQRFPFTVSPRGAAQQVYNEQVQQRVDPALLEQVGPRHYRLRAFPIPPKRDWETEPVSRPMEMHLWLSYKVMRQESGWKMPELAEKRNIFWNRDTERLYIGANKPGKLEDWLPAYVSATGKNAPTVHQVTFSDSDNPKGILSDRIEAKPLKKSDYSLPQGKRFAVVLDSSRSMGDRVRELNQTFDWLKAKGFADNNFANNDADLYITATAGATPQRIDNLRQFEVPKQTFYGTIQLKQILQQFAQLQGDTAYDGILLVTDQGSYELSDDSKAVPAIKAPLWVVHLGGQLPPAYDDATLQAIQNSGGGVSTDIPEVLQRLATKEALGKSVVNVVEGYAWSLHNQASEKLTEPTPTNQNSSKGFEPLAARQLVLGLSQEKDTKQVTQLDAIHAIAKTYDIVTPYSSMIVLVNDEQREALKRAEQKSDRFDREVESGNEQLTQPSNPLNVSGTPEPAEWMLLLVVAIALIAISRYQRRTIS
ncbi:MAG: TIGR02921 family PEP-CTERM protein [Kastovskya adunca ATA6-11-RM4]|jgi:putative PEP-CTERM system integral membrane protein|nr:TIGR02921 family PEP-CTERM protein [Kastovskya adunca ATA6-11-RM4]